MDPTSNGTAGILKMSDIQLDVEAQQGKRMPARKRERRVAVTESPPPGVAPPDYADAFEVARRPADARSAENWAHDGFGRLPIATREAGLLAHRLLLGFRLGPWGSPDHIFGWKVVTSEPDLLHLEARSSWLTGHMLWRLHDTRLEMTTFIRYEMLRTGRLVWGALGNVHRASAPGLLRLAATAPRAR
jgi:hypothetical protein